MLSADTRQLKSLAKILRESDRTLYRGVQKGLVDVGQAVVEDAKRKASWSTRIPQTIRARASGLNAVTVSAGGASAPHAKPIEHGGAPGSFRHPVFGDKSNWVDQPARPFLHPAAIDRLQEHAERVAGVLSVEVEKMVGGVERLL